jgi:hypothetical protein
MCCTIPVVSLSLNHRLQAFILVRMRITRGLPQYHTALSGDGEPMPA